MEIDIVLFVATLLLAGAIAGITSGLFGNGGGFVVVPVLLAVFPLFSESSVDIMRVAVGTSLASIVISSARSVQAHKRKGAVDFDVLKAWTGWLIVGVIFGLVIASSTTSEVLVFVFASGVLLYSIYFLFPHMFVFRSASLSMPTGFMRAGLVTFLGGFSALLGIGGGTITVMTMTICGRQVHQSIATAAGVGFIIGLPGALGFLFMGQGSENLPYGTLGYVNIPALISISLASIVTAPLGAQLAHSLNEFHLKRLFGLYLVVVALSMFYKVI
ncbi:sulfite exporter TauE/SafE family protein [Brumicola blandensis]|uniref:Probable membrane transporter protein n=1 Tax=Brumicola blandensis TaxID=3075611 RepID=A0AAW8QZT1_9ALTE|nr:sulfite exporter TauE/SafE family protein [Alteromonas sp. W409]MDT0582294.1 sulfite exporter TauE/SafE family protein [Alteromonas sp. W409]